MALDGHLGILAVFTNCRDSQREGDFNRWYDGSYVRHLEESGAVARSSRYQNVTKANSGQAKYLAIHESNWSDQTSVYREITQTWDRLAADGSIHPALELVLRAQYEWLPPEFRGDRSNRAVQGLLVVLTDRRADVPDDEFNDWYANTHVPELLGTGMYHTANRYRLVASEPEAPEYAAIYETERDAAAAADALLEYRGKWTQHPVHGVAYEVGLRGVFQRI